MAHQPKAYKKFVATAATATLVATAIVPVASAATDFKDVSKTYEKEVNYLVENGIAKGTTDTTFGTNSNISRGDAAVMIANALKLDTTSAPDAGFQDVNARVAGAVNAIVEAKIASGKTATAFAPADYITRQEMAKMLANAYKLTAKENANFKDVNSNWIGYVSALKEAGITLGKTDTTFAPTDNLTRGEFALFVYRAEVGVAPATPEVVSVSATNAKALKVTFKGAIADTSKVTFDVKRGDTTKTTVSGLEVSWNDAKTEATLASDVNLVADTYTVTAGGLEFAEGKNTATVKVEAQKITGVEILSGQLIKNSAGNAGTFTYKVVDQYGTDITKSVANSAFNVSAVVGTSTPSVTLDPAKGVGTVSHTFVSTDKTAVVTIVHKATGVAKTATLEVAAAATVESLTFGDNVLPTNKTRIETGLGSAVKVPVTVKDQYGNTIKDLNTLNGSLTLVSSTTGASFSFESDEDGNPFVVLDTTGMSDKGTVVLTAVNPTSGKVFSKSFDVVKAAAPYKIELGELSVQTVAAGDEDVILPIKVYDQFGGELTADQIVANKAAIEAWVTGDNNAYVSDFLIVSDKNSKNYGKFAFDAGIKGTAALVINTPAGIFTKLIEVKDARVVTTVSKIDPVTLLQGATTNLEFVFKDQYGEEVDAADNDDLTYEIKVTRLSGDADGIVVDSPSLTGTDEEDLAKIKLTAATNKTGSYRVTVNLLDAGVAVSSANTTVNVAKNNAVGLEYSVADVPVLNGSTDNTGTLSAANVYAQKLVLTAKDANGQTFVINKDDLVSVVSSNQNVAKVGKDGSDWFVAGNNVTGLTGEQKATLTFKVNTLDGLKTLTKEVTVSKEAPKVQDLKVVSQALGAATKNISGVVERSIFTLATTTAGAQASPDIFVIGKDQYGVWNNEAAPQVFVNSTDVASKDAFTITGNKLTVASGKVVTPGKDIKVTLTKDTGSAQITVRATNAGTITLVNNAGVITVTSNYGLDLQGTFNAVDIKGGATTAVAVADSSSTPNAVKLSLSAAPVAAVDTLTATLDPATDKITIAGSATGAVNQTINVTILDSSTGVSKTVPVKLTASEAGPLTVGQ